MTETSDEAALLAAIAAHPEEDTPRLAYADLLDETGRHERAEFIRAQVGAARLTRPENCVCGYRGSPVCDPCVEWGRLTNRSTALLATHGRGWCKVPCANPLCRGGYWPHSGDPNTYPGKCHHCSGTGRYEVVWERGFPLAVKCGRLEDVVEYRRKRCTAPGCEDGTVGRPKPGSGPGGQWMGRMCNECDGTGEVTGSEWRPTAWALSVVRWHPVTRFEVTDARPFETMAGYFRWWKDDPHASPGSSLPGPVYDAVINELVEGGLKAEWPRTRDAALAALYRALGTVVRRGASAR
jgi:uncharacterized protein (TIGR02996 family)